MHLDIRERVTPRGVAEGGANWYLYFSLSGFGRRAGQGSGRGVGQRSG